jgi:hypothetical protein
MPSHEENHNGEPKIKEVSVHWGGGGKVQLEEFGKQTSEYSINISRKYEVPGEWTDSQIAIFELETISAIKEQVEPIIAEEHELRMQERDRISSGD